MIAKIRALADEDLKCSLAISLNAPNEEKRRALMPKAARASIDELLDAGRYFIRRGGRRVTLEYVLLKGLNASPEDAVELGRRVKGTPFKLNLIPYNPGRQQTYDAISEADIDRFVTALLPYHATVTVRRSRGLDIDAACGQLWTQSLTEPKTPRRKVS